MRSPFLLPVLATLLVGILACDRRPEAPAAPRTHAVSGTVAGAPASGVVVTLSGPTSATVVTGPEGTYAFAGLPDGSYTVTPSLPGHGFFPATRPVSLSGADVDGKDFAATPAPVLGAVEPAEAAQGATVTVTGERFGTWRPGSAVVIGLVPMQVISWTDDRILVRVPRGASGGALRVVAAGTATSPVPFAVTSAVLASARTP